MDSYRYDWANSHTREICRIDKPSEPMEILGSHLGTSTEIDHQFSEAVEKISALHDHIHQLEDVAIEFILTRK